MTETAPAHPPSAIGHLATLAVRLIGWGVLGGGSLVCGKAEAAGPPELLQVRTGIFVARVGMLECRLELVPGGFGLVHDFVGGDNGVCPLVVLHSVGGECGCCEWKGGK